MKKIRKQTAAGIAVMLMLAMMLGGCGAAAEMAEVTEEESAVTVSVQNVGTGTITLTNSFVGTISPEETVMVIPLAAGTGGGKFFLGGGAVQAGGGVFFI